MLKNIRRFCFILLSALPFLVVSVGAPYQFGSFVLFFVFWGVMVLNDKEFSTSKVFFISAAAILLWFGYKDNPLAVGAMWLLSGMVAALAVHAVIDEKKQADALQENIEKTKEVKVGSKVTLHKETIKKEQIEVKVKKENSTGKTYRNSWLKENFSGNSVDKEFQ